MNLKTSAAARVKYLMDIHGFSNDYAMERATGVSRSTIKNILTRNRIGPKSARQIGQALKVPIAWVESGFGPIPQVPTAGPKVDLYALRPEDADNVAESGDRAADTVAPPSEEDPTERVHAGRPGLAFSKVPKANSKLSAGGGIFPEEGTTGEDFAFRLDWLHQVATSPRNVILLDVDGDSMAPTLLPGDTILVDLGRTQLRGGHIYAIAIGEVVQIKRLQWLAPDKIRVIADNPAYYTHDIHPSEIRIIGQAIWYGRTLI